VTARSHMLLRERLLGLRDDDRGVAMVLVLSLSVIIAALVAVTIAMALQSLRSSRQHVSFESALSVAETGIDETLAQINTAFNQAPSTNWVSPAPCDWSVSSFASADTEKTLARARLLAVAANSACRKQAGSGEYVAIHPTGNQTVYAMSFVPSYQAFINNRQDAKARVLKAEYIFAPYKPGQAVLTSGDLDFSGGSVVVNTLNPGYPADIHSNTDVTGTSSSLDIEGSISSSGDNSMNGSCPAGVQGGCTEGEPLERVPAVTPRQVYDKQALNTEIWYDLCPGGVVKLPAATGPCTGAVNAEQPSGGAFRGWQYTAGSTTSVPVWTLTRQSGTTTYPGAYYIYGADAQVGDSGNDSTVWNITVLADSAKGSDAPAGFSEPDRCNKYGGNLDWRLFTIQNYVQGLIFNAEGTLSGTANTAASAGFLWAGDNIDLHTSSNTVTGAVISNNLCAAAGPNAIQGVTVNYDQTIVGPVSDIVRTTLWLEYVG
jgi:Tfp pilus assembly protein PilX